MRPLSYYIPKILLPVRGKPVLNHLLDNMKNLNIETHYVVVSEHIETVNKYITNTGLDDKVKLVRGLEWESGGDLAIAIEQIDPKGDIIVMNGDVVTDIDMAKVYEDHERSPEAYITIAATTISEEKAKRFGRVTLGSDNRVTQFAEKAKSGPNLINVGFYVFDEKLVSKEIERREHLTAKKFKYEVELFPQLAKEGKLFASVQPAKYYWDVGTMESYLEAEDFFANRSPMPPNGV